MNSWTMFRSFNTFTTSSILVFEVILHLKFQLGYGMNISDNTCDNVMYLTDMPWCIDKDYDKSTAPISVLPLNITILLKILDVIEVNDHKNTITFSMILNIYWIESRIKLNLKSPAWMYNDTSEKALLLNSKWVNVLWQPTLDMKNMKQFQPRQLVAKQQQLVLHGNKMLSYHWPVEATLNCPLFEFKMYPFDKQVCEFHVGSFEYHSGISLYNGDVLYDSDNQRPLQYNVPNITALSFEDGLITLTHYYYTSNGKRKKMAYEFSYFAIRMEFKRRFAPFFYTTYLTSFLLVLCSWIGFLIDPSCVPGRITLSVTLLLTLINMR